MNPNIKLLRTSNPFLLLLFIPIIFVVFVLFGLFMLGSALTGRRAVPLVKKPYPRERMRRDTSKVIEADYTTLPN